MNRPTEGEACPVCGGRSHKYHFGVHTDRDYSIVQCRQCGLAFTLPRPTEAELAAFYSRDYFVDAKGPRGYADYRNLGELNAHRMWGEFVEFPQVRSAGARKILDVGCATGGFLAEAKAGGWDCTGVEFAEYAADIARREHGLNVLTGGIHHQDLPAGAFDFVTMWHVLEHDIEPMKMLARARELLRPGGYVFVELPNWNSVGRMVRGARWSQLSPPQHINFFTPAALQAAVKSAGFAEIRATSVYPSLRDQATRLKGRGHVVRKIKWAVARIACLMGRGGYARIISRKPLS